MSRLHLPNKHEPRRQSETQEDYRKRRMSTHVPQETAHEVRTCKREEAIERNKRTPDHKRRANRPKNFLGK